MRIDDFTGTIALQSPVHHGGEKRGNETYVREIAYIIDGKQVMVPFISGNSIRHTLRAWLAEDLLDSIDYHQEDEKKFAKVWHCLTGGGMLESKSEKDAGVIDMKLKAEMRRMLPVFAIFGGTIGNQIFEGNIDVGMAIPYAQEISKFLPTTNDALPKLREIVQRDFGTRHDKFKDIVEGDEKSNQMIYYNWCLSPGVKMHHRFVLRNATDLELSAFGRAMELWALRPVVGGKAGIGLGRVDMEYSPELPSPDIWNAFLEKNAESISELLHKIEAGI